MTKKRMMKCIKEADQLKIAVHEAGHAVLVYHFKAIIRTVNIRGTSTRSGITRHWGDVNKPFDDAVISCGGFAAESITFGVTNFEAQAGLSQGDFTSLHTALQSYCKLKRMKLDAQFDQLYQKANDEAFRILGTRKNKRAILRIADALGRKKHLNDTEVIKIIQRA